MPELNLDAILACADAADDGPWTVEPSSLYVQNAEGEVVASFDWLAESAEEWAQLEANARFAAAARTAVPNLAAEVKRLREQIERVREVCDKPVIAAKGDGRSDGSVFWQVVDVRDVLAALDGAGPVLNGWRKRALTAEADRNRVRQLAKDMKTSAMTVLAREPVENGISAGERYEAEVDLAVAERVLAALNGQAMER